MTRVSSQAIRSAAARISSARSVMSRRLPIGVATRCRPGRERGRLDRLPVERHSAAGLRRALPAVQLVVAGVRQWPCQSSAPASVRRVSGTQPFDLINLGPQYDLGCETSRAARASVARSRLVRASRAGLRRAGARWRALAPICALRAGRWLLVAACAGMPGADISASGRRRRRHRPRSRARSAPARSRSR